MKDKLNFEYLKAHKKMIIIGALILAAVIGILFYKLYDRNKVYSAYRVEYNIKADTNVDNTYYKFGTGVIKYSSDGISYINNGKEVWNHGFEVKTPLMDICGDYLALADDGSNEISIFDIAGNQMQVSASYPVHGVEVSKQGVVAGLLSDEKANYIEVISKDGTQIAIGRTVLQGDGYPISISLSEDAQKVAASYIAVSSGEARSKIVFYNYSEVGQNETDRIVGGFNDFSGTIIPKMEFVNKDTVVALGDNMFVTYSIEETPTELKRVKIKQEIKSAVCNEKYIVLITEGEAGDELNVYDIKGKKLVSKKLDFRYSDIKIADSNILMYNDTECEVMSVKGVKKFKYKFNSGITSMVPLSDTVYVIANGDNVQQITLD